MTDGLIDRAKQWARTIKRDVVALWIAGRDPRVPWYAKFAAGLVAAYALSPIDLIPDFIPVLGYLDEVVLLPFAIMLVVKLIPSDLMDEFRAEAIAREGRPTSTAGQLDRPYLERGSGGADLGVLARKGAVAFTNHRPGAEGVLWQLQKNIG